MTRRFNLGSVAFATLLFGSTLTVVTASVVTLNPKTATATTVEPSSRWLDSVKAPHRQLFDAPMPLDGIPLIHVFNYYETLNKAFNVKDSDIDGVLTFYGGTTFYGLNDAMWSKYHIGEFLGAKDAKGEFLTANPWRANPTILGMQLPQASIEGLKKRGFSKRDCAILARMQEPSLRWVDAPASDGRCDTGPAHSSVDIIEPFETFVAIKLISAR